MILGFGIPSSYQAFKSVRPYELDFKLVIFASITGFDPVILGTLIYANRNGNRISTVLRSWTINVYIVLYITINISLVWNSL